MRAVKSGRFIQRPVLLLLLLTLALLSPSGNVSAKTPDWAKPYMKTNIPTDGFIAKKDKWLVVYKEIIVKKAPSGGLAVTHREVLTPLGGESRKLLFSLDYDEGLQTLSTPQVVVPGLIFYKTMKLDKHSIDVADLDQELIGSSRILYLGTKPIDPGRRVAVSWTVTDKYEYPGERVFSSLGDYPVCKFNVKPAPEGDIRVGLVDPVERIPSYPEGGVTLTNLPAYRRIYPSSDNWLPDPLFAVPVIFTGTSKEAQGTWEDESSRINRLFEIKETPEERAKIAQKVRALCEGVKDRETMVEILCRFVAGLSYRDIAWGQEAFAPVPPSETLRTGNADCKGKVILLKAMLAVCGIESVPVLCRKSERYFELYPQILASVFNHVIIAVKIEGDTVLPATLKDGPGKGWVLCDPTDPLAVFGVPPTDLEGTKALWIAPEGGGIFTVHTVDPSVQNIHAKLKIKIESPEKASFVLGISGEQSLLGELSSTRSFAEPAEILRERIEKFLQGSATGLHVTNVMYNSSMKVGDVTPRLTINGTIPSPLQDIGGGMYSCPSLMAMVGRALDIPYSYIRGDVKPDPDKDKKPDCPVKCVTQPNYEGIEEHKVAEIVIELPDGFEIEALPALSKPVDSPWLKVDITKDTPISVELTVKRGAFPNNSVEARLKDLNTMATLFRQSMLFKETETGD